MTPITRANAPLPDARAQTDKIIAALQQAMDAIGRDTPQAQETLSALKLLSSLTSPPPESYPELTMLDDAICEALKHLPMLCRHAPESELRQTLKTLRRIILSDRRRIDPDAERHALYIGVALRQTWLIGHRSGLLHARAEQIRLRQLLERVPEDDANRPALTEHMALLAQYLAAQEGYGASIQREMNDLQYELNR